MARDRQTIGPCPGGSPGTVSCKHNLFVKDTPTIHSWEHRCSDCSHRVTQAFRSHQSEAMRRGIQRFTRFAVGQRLPENWASIKCCLEGN